MADSDRIKQALDVAVQYGGIDGAHHKAWTIDQIVRTLTGCPMVDAEAIDSDGYPYKFQKLGESPEYLEWVREARDGEDGPETYEWDVGVPP